MSEAGGSPGVATSSTGATTEVVVTEGTKESTGAKINLNPSEAVTFDELDEVIESEKRAKREAKNKAKEETEDKKSLTSNAEGKSEAKAPKPEAKDKEESDKETEAGEKEAQKKLEAKLRKYRLAETEAEMDEAAEFFAKVDGQEMPVALRDLLANYSGKVAWDKKFSSLDNERKTVKQSEAKVQKINQKIEAILNEADPEMRFYRMSELSGKDPVEIRTKFLQDNMDLLEKYYTMTEDERKADALGFENRILKQRQADHQREQTERQSLQTLDQSVSKLLATHNLDKPRFIARYDELQKLVSDGVFKPEQVTPDFIAETIVKDNLWESAANKIKSAGVTVPSEKIMKLVDLAYSQGLGQEDIAEMADNLWGTVPAKQAVKEKLAQRQEVLTGKKESTPKPAVSKEEPMFFNEL